MNEENRGALIFFIVVIVFIIGAALYINSGGEKLSGGTGSHYNAEYDEINDVYQDRQDEYSEQIELDRKSGLHFFSPQDTEPERSF